MLDVGSWCHQCENTYGGDEGSERLDNVGAAVALHHHIQIHDDPFVLFAVA